MPSAGHNRRAGCRFCKITGVNPNEQAQARLFALIERGARQGRLSYQEINEALGEVNFDEDAAEALFEVLEARSIEVVNDAPAGEKPVAAASPQPKPAVKPAPPRPVGEHEDLDELLESIGSLEEFMATKHEEWELAMAAEAKTEEADTLAEPLEDAYRLYTRKMASVARRSPAEEAQLARDARDGDLAARQELVESNWRLVVFLARRASEKTTLPLNDLMQEGMIGLLKAVDNFDPTRGQRLGAYATWFIRQSINKAVADNARSMRLPSHMYGVIQKIKRAQGELSQTLGRMPSRQEISLHTGLAVPLVEEGLRSALTPVSLDAPVGEDDDMELGELVGDIGNEAEEATGRRELREGLEKSLEALSGLERAVISRRFGLGDYETAGAQTVDDVAKQMNLSRERVRQLEIRTLRKLRRRAQGTAMDD